MVRRTNTTKEKYRALLAKFNEIFDNQTDAERCYKLTDQQVTALLSQTQYLHWRTRYVRDDGTQDFTDVEKDQIQALAADLEHRLITPDDCVDCPDDTCVEYQPNASFIDWFPNDPFNPSGTPDGYAQPPWYVINDSVVGGYLDGDVLCDATTTLPASVWDYLSILFTSGAPRIRVHVSGQGQVELHLLKIALGGMALVWVDDDYATADVLDMQTFNLGDIAPGTLDLLSFIDNAIDGDFSDVYIHEVYIETPGEHHIDIAFLPILDLNIISMGWGGGLRKVVLCGFDQMAIVPVFRVVTSGDCSTLEYKYNNEPDSAYVELFTVCDGDDGSPGTPGAPGDDCDCEPNPEAPDMPETPVNGIGTDKLCDFASFMVEVVLPDAFEQVTDAAIASATNDAFTALLLGMLGAATGGAGYVLFGIAAAASAVFYGLRGAFDQYNATTAQTEAIPAFWDDVKCVIYCNMPMDGIFDQEAADTIADKILDELLGTYPNAAGFLSAIIRSLSPEIRAQYTVLGALYDGSDCGGCGCDPSWDYATNSHPLECRPSQYLEIVSGAWQNDFTEITTELISECHSEAQIIIDLRGEETEMYQIQAGSPAYPTDSGCGFPTRWRIIEAWNESTGQWYDVYRGTAIGFGGTHQIVPTTRMLRITINGHSGDSVEYFWWRVWGRRTNPFYVECEY